MDERLRPLMQALLEIRRACHFDWWDGEKAAPIGEPVVLKAALLLHYLAARSFMKRRFFRNLPSVAPSRDGGILLTWDLQDDTVTVEVPARGNDYEVVIRESGQTPERLTLSDWKAILPHVNWVLY